MSSAADRTEKATPKRRQEAQKKGQIARSIEVNTAVVLLATVAALAVFGPRMMTDLENVLRDGLITAGDPDNALRGSVGKVLRHNLMELARAGRADRARRDGAPACSRACCRCGRGSRPPRSSRRSRSSTR